MIALLQLFTLNFFQMIGKQSTWDLN